MINILIRYVAILFLLAIATKKIIEYIKTKKKIKIFLLLYFNEDRLYNIDEIANAFKLDKEHLLDILETLENYNYFKRLKKNGVTLIKDYYSLYEIKIILKVVSKKVRL